MLSSSEFFYGSLKFKSQVFHKYKFLKFSDIAKNQENTTYTYFALLGSTLEIGA